MGQSTLDEPIKSFVLTLHCVGVNFEKAFRAEVIAAFAQGADQALVHGKNNYAVGTHTISVLKDSSGRVVGKLELIVG